MSDGDRDQEIENEFQLVDFEGKGRISRADTLEHMSQKHGELDMPLIEEVFREMNWNYQGEVTKQDFCKKYLAKQKQLYSQANRYSSLRKKVETTRTIFDQTKKTVSRTISQKPALYAIIKLQQTVIKSEDPYLEKEDMMSLEVQYEDHQNKLQYVIEQPVHGADQTSFELVLPVQQRYFFVRYKFINPKSKVREPFGQCYVNYPIADIIRSGQYGPNAVKKANTVRSDITKNNEVKGYCQFNIVFQSDLSNIQKKIEEEEKQLSSSTNLSEQKQKEYQYLQYLWGIRHKYPHKIAREDVKWMIITRLVLACLLAILSVVVHSLGRCEPLSFILAMMVLKNWKYVILRSEKFLITWIAIFAIFLDIIWVAFASDQTSLINFMKLGSAAVFTYLLIITKIVLVIYMVIFEKSLSSGHEKDTQSK